MDLELIEAGNGGDLVYRGTDLSTINGFQNMIYLAMFGGNVGFVTPTNRPVNTQMFDWWGNSLFFRDNPEFQMNSLTEYTLRNTPLTSSGLSKIEQSVNKDLEFMRSFADLTVSIELVNDNRVKIEVLVIEPNNQQNKSFIFIWDATEAELPDDEVVIPTIPLPDIPNAPTGLSLTVVGADQIDADWDVQLSVDSFTIEWDTVNTFDSPNYDSDTVNGSTFDYSIIGLDSNTLYYVRVNATNTGGTSPYSSIVSDTTDSLPFTFTVNATDGMFTFPQRSGTPRDYIMSVVEEPLNTIAVTSETDPTTFTFAGGAGTYTIQIVGTGIQPYFNNTGDKDKLLDVLNWGACIIDDAAFYGCSNLTFATATDNPVIVSLSSAFRNCTLATFNPTIDNWSTGASANFAQTFQNCQNFNQPIGSWDVSSATNISVMFGGATAFNQDLSSWDVTNVQAMSGLFDNAQSFNQNINSWVLSATVTNLSSLFLNASAFNQPLSSWDTSNITTMARMFEDATTFNQDLSSWNVSSVTQFNGMFNRATAFNQDLSSWVTSSASNMTKMFEGATVFNQDLSTWNVGSVTTMIEMFKGANAFNSPLFTLTSTTTRIDGIFQSAIAFNQNINNWDVSNVTSLFLVFNTAQAFNQPLDNWDVSSVTNMSRVFQGCTVFDSAIFTATPTTTNMSQMFRSMAAFNQDLSTWDVSGVTNMNAMFRDAGNFDSPIFNITNTTTNLGAMFDSVATFNQDVSGSDFTGVAFLNDFVRNTAISSANYNALLAKLRSDAEGTGITFGMTLGANGLVATGQGVIDRTWLINNAFMNILDATP